MESLKLLLYLNSGYSDPEAVHISACNYRGEQVHVMCTMEELMPSIGTTVPSPSLLAAVLWQSESTLQNIAKIYVDAPSTPSSNVDIDNPFDFSDDSLLVSKTRLISISDDGKVWNWLLSAEGASDARKENSSIDNLADDDSLSHLENKVESIDSSNSGTASEGIKELENARGSKSRSANSSSNVVDISFKVGRKGSFCIGL